MQDPLTYIGGDDAGVVGGLCGLGPPLDPLILAGSALWTQTCICCYMLTGRRWPDFEVQRHKVTKSGRLFLKASMARPSSKRFLSEYNVLYLIETCQKRRTEETEKACMFLFVFFLFLSLYLFASLSLSLSLSLSVSLTLSLSPCGGAWRWVHVYSRHYVGGTVVGIVCSCQDDSGQTWCLTSGELCWKTSKLLPLMLKVQEILVW